MAVDVSTSDLNPDVKTVALSGRFDMYAAEEATPMLLRAMTQSASGVLVDLAAVDFISSAGLRALIATNKAARSDGKKTALIRARPEVYKIFKVAALDPVFSFFEDEAQAIQAVWPSHS